ncbi:MULTISPECIES: hypothetical protein [Roseomonadaceae]|uniref:ABC transmembrane type-1 domain-containing protein n=1 Tax=Falsiroseomonas oleicola TaxID=2801474 RepID=A0ABS6H7T5_9PROT|nr:hypothetical protein [Roseomonas oleicola]MBU8544759.1 hypothetical protein [Roseomonas oleicola]
MRPLVAGTGWAARWRRPLSPVLRLLWEQRLWILGLLAVVGIIAALRPGFAAIAKAVAQALRDPGVTVFALLGDHAPAVAMLGLALGIMQLAERVLKRGTRTRVTIALQNVYLGQGAAPDAAMASSHVLYGCEIGAKGLEAAYHDAPRIAAALLSGGLWQAGLGAEWLPLVLLSVPPAIALAWLAGRPIEGRSRMILSAQRDLAAGASGPASGVAAAQGLWLRATLLIEALKWLADRMVEVGLWLSVLTLGGFAWLAGVPLLPAEPDVAQTIATLVNLQLLAIPIGEMGKLSSKWWEARPAIERSFRPR